MERATDHSPLPSVSIVIEWDNVVLTDASRPRAMLAALRPQLKAAGERIRSPIQLIAVHDELEVSREAVERLLASELVEHGADVEIELLSTRGLRYYEQKNAGAAKATRDVVLFFDCDTIPQDGWLETLLDGFADPERQIVAGHTEVETSDFLARCFALFWFFDRRAPPEGETRTFKANNVAFRRPLFETLRFPDSVGFRCSHLLLIDELARRGIAIWLRPQARILHPRPRTLRAAAVRAVCQGHDQVIRLRQRGITRPGLWRKYAKARFRDEVRRSAQRIREEHAEVGLGRVGAAVAFVLATTYHLLALAGALVTARDPELVRRYLSL